MFSLPEIEVKEILDNLGVHYIAHFRELISPLEVDFYLPDYKVAIEVNPSYTHSLNRKGKSYHFEKWLRCSSLGVRLISVFDNISRICLKDMIKYSLSPLSKDATYTKVSITNEHKLFIKLYGFEEFNDCEVIEVRENGELVGVCPIMEFVFPIMLKQSDELWETLRLFGTLKLNNNLYSYKDTHRILQTIPEVVDILDSNKNKIAISTCGYSLIK